MCKHVPNAAVSIRTACCKRWLDCTQCHEGSDHPLLKTLEMILVCKKCKKVFRLKLDEIEEADEHCPGCDNHFVRPAAPAEQADENTVQLNVELDAEAVDQRTKKQVELTDEELAELAEFT